MPQIEDSARRPLYDAARRFVEFGLLSDDSLFTPGRAVWTRAVLDDLHERFVLRSDDSPDRFEQKLQRQLDGADAATIQLAAEILFVHFLAPVRRSIAPERKRAQVERVLSWSAEPVAISADLLRALEQGIASTGTAFLAYRPKQLELLIELARRVKTLSQQERRVRIGDPWAFKELLFSIPIHAAQTQREALLHLVHPDVFEPIVSQQAKERIAERFTEHVTEPTADLDLQIAQIRRGLTTQVGPFRSFYEPQVRPLWDHDTSRWGQFIAWARRFYEGATFDETERGYKLEVAQKLLLARAAAESGSQEWVELLKRAFGPPNNMTSWRVHGVFLDWCAAEPKATREVILGLWSGEGDLPERVAAFTTAVQSSIPGLGSQLSLASVLALAIDAQAYPPYRVTPFQKAFELVAHPPPAKEAGAAEVYKHALDFLDLLSNEAAARGLELRDRLDAQGVLWAVVKNTLPEPATERERKQLERWRGGAIDDTDDVTRLGPEPKPDELGALAALLLFETDHLRRIQLLLEDKRQVILHGPPGTGKTFVARKLAHHLAGGDSGVKLVQFHPSYAYEDFVEGYRPASSGQPGFVLRRGPLKELALAAARERDRRFILVIDEINRGNVAKVFGELYFLLEYRGEFIRLQYSDEEFSLPENLWILATMNTADRSIALVDAALRRRFHFVPFFPDEPPIEGLLRRFLARHHPRLTWVADAVDHVNAELADRNLAVGPSHFLRQDLSEEWVELIWTHSVLPYLEEQLFGETERLRSFRLRAVRARLGAAEAGSSLGEIADAPRDPD